MADFAAQREKNIVSGGAPWHPGGWSRLLDFHPFGTCSAQGDRRHEDDEPEARREARQAAGATGRKDREGHGQVTNAAPPTGSSLSRYFV